MMMNSLWISVSPVLRSGDLLHGRGRLQDSELSPALAPLPSAGSVGDTGRLSGPQAQERAEKSLLKAEESM